MPPELLPTLAEGLLRVVHADAPFLRAGALACLYQRFSPAERERQIKSSLEAAEKGEFSLEHLLAAVDGGQIVGAILAVRRPGGVAFLWPPAVVDNERVLQIAGLLLQAAAQRLDHVGVSLTQCLLEPDDLSTGELLAWAGFPKMTNLILLNRPLVPRREETAFSLSTVEYSAASHRRFVEVIERTYVETLDCPALSRRRSGEQLLESHRATGCFHAEYCLLFRAGGEDVGVLLAAEHPERDAWEVGYIGIVPEARRKGYGRAILKHTLTRFEKTSRRNVEIAVDAENEPAVRLYSELDFQEQRRFAVYLRFGPHEVK